MLTTDEVEARPGHFLVDEIVPGAPLLITFSFVDWGGDPAYYLYGRSLKLERLLGRRFNRILLRDCGCHWYQRGIPGLGEDIESTVESLRRIIEPMRPERIIAIGESMGAYGAIGYGVRLNADRILAFGPLSHLRADEAETFHDRRWMPVMQGLLEAPPPRGYDLDLCDLIASYDWHGRIDLGFGTRPDARFDGQSADTVCLDAVHAWRLARLPQVRLHPFEGGTHAVTAFLKQANLSDSFLLRHGFDLPRDPLRFESAAELAAAQLGDSDWLQSAAIAGAPLVIACAESPWFEWAPDLLQWSEARGRPLNLLLLRDRHNSWYQRGIAGTGIAGNDIDGSGNDMASNGVASDGMAATLTRIRALAQALDAPAIFCIGQGKGAFGALLLGLQLPAQRLFAFAPIAQIDPDESLRYHDRRHLDAHRALQDRPPPGYCCDLLTLAKQSRWSGRIELVFGTRSGTDSTEDVHHDAVNALRLSTIGNSGLHPLPQAGSNPRAWLAQQGLLQSWLDRAME